MKANDRAKTWLSFVLGLMCLGLFLRLVFMSNTVRAGSRSSRLASALPHGPRHAQRRSHSSDADSFPSGPVLRLSALTETQSRPLPALDRDPFHYAPTPEQVKQAAARRAASEAAKNAPPLPPAPPPVPFKALGYSEKTNGALEAYLSDDEQIYVVHVGDELAKKFKVVRITPVAVEIQDETYHQTSELPLPQ